MKLRTKIILGILPLIIISITLVSVSTMMLTTRQLERSISRYMEVVLENYLRDEVKRRYEVLERNGLETVESFVREYQRDLAEMTRAMNAKEIFDYPSAHIFVMKAQTFVQFGSAEYPRRGAGRQFRQYAEKAAANPEKYVKGYTHSGGREEYFVARHFQPWNWTVFFAIAKDDIYEGVSAIRNATILITLLGSVVGLLFILLIFRQFFYRPLHQLEEVAASITRHEKVHDIDIRTRDEIGGLARSLEVMAREISQYEARLEAWREELEKEVALRTNDLMKSNERLENEIAERRSIEQMLKLNQFAMDQASDAVFWVRSDGGFFYANNAACMMVGYAREKLLTLSYFDLDRDYDRQSWSDLWDRIKATRHVMLESKIQAKDGKLIPVEISCNYIEFADQELCCNFARDLTQRKELEKSQANARKFESIAMLASGIVHDFNNLLAVITGNIDMARDENLTGMQRVKMLDSAYTATMRAKDLTRTFLIFSSGGTPIKKQTNLKDLVKSCINQVKAETADVDFNLIVSEELCDVEVDVGQMSQAIVNVLLNACQSMPDGGSVSVTLENCYPHDMDCEETKKLEYERYLRAIIRDIGFGIEEQYLPYVFDPYFSTRDRGAQKGMGLGLTITYSVIRKHNGHIFIVSEPAKGTTVTIYLPCVL